jgi:hypothetical protein
MDDMGTPGPNHPAHRGLKPDKDNVAQLPGMHMRRLRVFKNAMLDHILGPEQVHYDHSSDEHDEKMPPDVAQRFDEHLGNLMSEDRNSHLKDGVEDGNQEAKIISMGKFKESRDNKNLLGKQYD